MRSQCAATATASTRRRNEHRKPASGTSVRGAVMAFTTSLVGVLPNNVPATPPLFTWTWFSNYNNPGLGAPGSGQLWTTSVSGLLPPPGSGTGGVTITNINGAPQTPPSVNCSTTPNSLWPPNGKPVLVTVSGTITPGTSGLVATTYAVNDTYGQVQPTGSIVLGVGGTYSFGVSLIASRNGKDKNGRTYTIMVGTKDIIGNVGVSFS